VSEQFAIPRVTRREVVGAVDPLALFKQVLGSRDGDALLFESLDATTRAPVRSMVLADVALRATCRGRQVTLESLSACGQAAMTLAREHLVKEAFDVTGAGDRITVTAPAPPHDAAEHVRLTATSPLDVLRALLSPLRRGADDPGHTLGPMVAGVFAYDLLDAFEALPPANEDPLGYPDYQCWLPTCFAVIDHRAETTTWWHIAYTEGVAAQAEATIGAMAAMAAACSPVDMTERIAPPALRDPVRVDLDDEGFAALVKRLKMHINKGDVFQVVPSRTFSAPCSDPLAAYARLRRLNPSPYMFYVKGPKHTVFGASPETCVRVDGATRQVDICPIAGTAKRGRDASGNIDRDLDGRLEAALRLSEKELAEHMMLIDLARNDVARVSVPGSRHVSKLLTVDRYAHVMHLVSHVSGTLRPDLDALHAYAAGMNMGTLVGAPKIRAATLLREHEATRRGPYGGGVGYITAAGAMDTAIVIRSATVTEGQAHVRAGAGVVYLSLIHISEPTRPY